ncbi:hypothetical protein KVR01_002192 [Diaporthe batatas]|uniref:uncharacterized protein n=1 Tax=Diaporthe batatas TaxID=748121 RepID=UPI001D056C2A|nr:uncharacterized protein KVR01_002192 [Diaporthe batatas]KAG8166503.1 hypothetical protein KVR01_002192 [Diaporthe batatas]
MHGTLTLYLLAMLLGQGCLILGELISKNDLSAFLASREDLSIFFELIKTYPRGLDGVPSMAATFLIPDNQAFDKLTGWNFYNETQAIDTIRYHIFPDIVPVSTTHTGIPVFARTLQSDEEVVFTSGADRRSTLLKGDIKIADGLIQIIDTVMMPPPDLEQICSEYTPLSAFLGALYRTNLAEEIITSKEVTIFAPNDAAFQRTAGALSNLSTPELAEVLKFHVVPGAVLYSTDLLNDTTLTTLNGEKITGPYLYPLTDAFLFCLAYSSLYNLASKAIY